MKNNVTIILEDKKHMTDLCGFNDSNLKTISELLETTVYSRGNEIHLDTEEEGKQQSFKSLVSTLIEQIEQGKDIGKDIIKAVFDNLTTGTPGDFEVFKRESIVIPNGYSVVSPRTKNQAYYIASMREYDVNFAIGPAGTGKTFLAIAYALKEVLTKVKRKLILTRPVVEAGENLGFLPGDLGQKLSPYLRPLYDAMESLVSSEIIMKLQDANIIEIAPLAYMRGRSLKDCFIILDEAQNTTREQMKMFLTRIGEGSKAIITGDISQIDLPKDSMSGLIHANKILKSIEEISFTIFKTGDVLRNPIVKKIIQAYESEKK